VIFIPEYLDGNKRVRADIQVQIPSPPPLTSNQSAVVEQPIPTAADSAVEVEPSVNADANVNSATDEAAVTAASTLPASQKMPDEQTADNNTAPAEPRKLASEKPSLAEQTIIKSPNPEEAVGWVVQLGSFKHQKNVRELVKKVDRAGYRSFTRPISTASGELTKVFIGPDTNKQNLQDALPHLQEITGLSGKITPFTAK
jgi:DedD protein